MGLLNYTTKVPVHRTIAEIVKMLVMAKAHAINQRYDGFGNIVALEFSVSTQFGQMGFRLPADHEAVAITMKAEANAGTIPKRFAGDMVQARRVAWRIIAQWVEAQLALIQISRAKPEQVFLSYAINPESGQTVYEMMVEQKFSRIALPERV